MDEVPKHICGGFVGSPNFNDLNVDFHSQQ